MPTNAHILVVDDNQAAADGLVRLLRALGQNAFALYDPHDALSYEYKQNIHLAFVDIGMPDIDGHELMRRLRASGFTSPAYALSGYGQEDDKERAREAGFTGHLTKPIGAAELKEVLQSYALA